MFSLCAFGSNLDELSAERGHSAAAGEPERGGFTAKVVVVVGWWTTGGESAWVDLSGTDGNEKEGQNAGKRRSSGR